MNLEGVNTKVKKETETKHEETRENRRRRRRRKRMVKRNAKSCSVFSRLNLFVLLLGVGPLLFSFLSSLSRFILLLLSTRDKSASLYAVFLLFSLSVFFLSSAFIFLFLFVAFVFSFDQVNSQSNASPNLRPHTRQKKRKKKNRLVFSLSRCFFLSFENSPRGSPSCCSSPLNIHYHFSSRSSSFTHPYRATQI